MVRQGQWCNRPLYRDHNGTFVIPVPDTVVVSLVPTPVPFYPGFGFWDLRDSPLLFWFCTGSLSLKTEGEIYPYISQRDFPFSILLLYSLLRDPQKTVVVPFLFTGSFWVEREIGIRNGTRVGVGSQVSRKGPCIVQRKLRTTTVIVRESPRHQWTRPRIRLTEESKVLVSGQNHSNQKLAIVPYRRGDPERSVTFEFERRHVKNSPGTIILYCKVPSHGFPIRLIDK